MTACSHSRHVYSNDDVMWDEAIYCLSIYSIYICTSIYSQVKPRLANIKQSSCAWDSRLFHLLPQTFDTQVVSYLDTSVIEHERGSRY